MKVVFTHSTGSKRLRTACRATRDAVEVELVGTYVVERFWNKGGHVYYPLKTYN